MYIIISKFSAMEYSTIYRSQDSSEIAIIKHLFEDHEIDHKVLGEVTSGVIAGAGVTGTRIQVREDQLDRAKEVLVESGFLGHRKASRAGRPAVSKWVLVFLAVLVLVIVALLITWFMNAP